MSETVKAKVSVLGNIETVEPDNTTMEVAYGLLLEFDNPESLRQALKDGRVEFALGE